MKLATYNPMQNMDYLFNSDSFFGNNFPFRGFIIEPIEPRVNIKNGDGAFVVEASVAGYHKDEINLAVEDNTLTLSGNKKEDNKIEGDGYKKKEFFCSSFKRSFNLSEEIEQENISAEVKNGVLTVNLPKKKKVQPKKIPITVN